MPAGRRFRRHRAGGGLVSGAKGGRNVPRYISVMLLAMLLLSPCVGGVKITFSARIAGPGEVRLEAVPGGGPAWVHYDQTGFSLLVWGHEGPDDVRLMGRDLRTREVLDIPAGFTVKGVEWGDFWDRIVVWGSPGEGLNDTLLFYRAPSWEVEEGFMPPGLLPLVEIDSAQLFASDIILAVAGRDANGTSRILVLEPGQSSIIRDVPVMDDRTVVHIGRDHRFMIVLDDGGRLEVFRTTDWTPMIGFDLMPGPFSSYFIEKGLVDEILGGQDGTIKTQSDLDKDEWSTFDAGAGPVLGVWFGNMNEMGAGDYIVAAVPGDTTSSTLQLWDPRGGSNWTLKKSFEIDGRVSMLTRDPRDNRTIVVGFENGSVSMYELVVKRHEVSERSGDWWVPLVVIPSTVLLLALVGYALYRWRKGRADG